MKKNVGVRKKAEVGMQMAHQSLDLHMKGSWMLKLYSSVVEMIYQAMKKLKL